MNIWQVSAGDGERDCSEVFLKYGVMLIGPGWLGDYRKSKHKNTKEYEEYNKPANKPSAQFIQRFDEAAEGELVVLKHAKKAVAVGQIKSEYDFKEVFSDVEGFDLRHCRHVEWRQPTRETPIRGFGRGRFSHVNKKQVRKEVKRLWEEGKREKSEEIPPEPEKVSRKALITSLIDGGLTRQRAKLIAHKTSRLRKLAEWYETKYEDYDVREHETRTFLIVPLIMSLGWDEKKIKIEWKHKDVALFDRPYSKQNKPVVIIESKRLWHGLGGASDQAKEYAKKHPTCYRLIVTDGIRYKLYTKSKRGGEWSFSAYLNLLIPTRKHPYESGVDGAVSFFRKMLPKGSNLNWLVPIINRHRRRAGR